MNNLKTIEFEVTTDGGKYTVRGFVGGSYEILRHGEPWISSEDTVAMTATRPLISLACDLNEYRVGRGKNPGLLPRELAEEVVSGAKLPKNEDGNSLPVTRSRLVELIALAVTRDRARGPLDADAIVERVIRPVLENSDALLWEAELIFKVKSLMRMALYTAQTRGARIASRTSIGEADYEEAVRAGCEAFANVLKDKGLM